MYVCVYVYKSFIKLKQNWTIYLVHIHVMKTLLLYECNDEHNAEDNG